MDAYEIVKFLHVLAAASWFGAAIAFFVLYERVRRSGDVATARALTAHGNAVGTKLFAPISGLTVIFGVVGVFLSEGAWKFTDLWILIGIGGVLVTGVTAGAIGTKLEKRIEELEAGDTSEEAQLEELKRKTRTLSIIDIVLLVVVIWAMVTKPML